MSAITLSLLEALALTTFKGVKGYWITVRGGKHVFVKSDWAPAGMNLAKKMFGRRHITPYLGSMLSSGAPRSALFDSPATRNLLRGRYEDVVLKSLSRLPENHLRKARVSRIAVISPQNMELLTGPRSDFSPNEVVAGFYRRGWKTKGRIDIRNMGNLYVKGEYLSPVPIMRRYFLHEFGHSLYGPFMRRARNRRIWSSAFEKDYDKVSAYSLLSRDSNETFSEAYSMYAFGAKSRARLKVVAPKSYRVMDRLFKGYYL